jgi:hypothetical protein
MNHLEMWHDAFVVIGTAAGALVGLLFVVMSIRLNEISERADDNLRATIDGARFNTIHLLTVLAESVVVLTPQPLTFIGVELIALNVFGLRGPLIFIKKYLNRHITISDRGGFPTALIATIICAYLLSVVGAAALLRLLEWGMYLVTAACVLKIARSVLTAWMLMFPKPIR